MTAHACFGVLLCVHCVCATPTLSSLRPTCLRCGLPPLSGAFIVSLSPLSFPDISKRTSGSRSILPLFISPLTLPLTFLRRLLFGIRQVYLGSIPTSGKVPPLDACLGAFPCPICAQDLQRLGLRSICLVSPLITLPLCDPLPLLLIYPSLPQLSATGLTFTRNIFRRICVYLYFAPH